MTIPSAPSERFHAEHARRFLRYIVDPAAGCTELRIFRADFAARGTYIVPADRFSKTIGGWYDDVDKLSFELMRLNGVSGYVTCNPAHRDLLSRLDNKLGAIDRGRGTNDTQITCLRWAFLDFDAERAADISATDAERSLALGARDKFLSDHPEAVASSIWGSSGNGGWVLARLPDYPNEPGPEALVKKFLARVGRGYGTNAVKVDPKTCNPSRVMGIAGTVKCKGSDRPERPWRLATIDSPEGHAPVPVELGAWLVANDDGLGEAEGREQGGGGHAKVHRNDSGHGGNGHNAGNGRLTVEGRAIAWLAKASPAISGQRGHDALLWAATFGPMFDLHPTDCLRILATHYNGRCVPPWSEAELEHKVSEKYKTEPRRGWGQADQAGRGVGDGGDENWAEAAEEAAKSKATQRTFSNSRAEEQETGDGETKTINVSLMLHEIDEALAAVAHSDLLRRVGSSLFAESADHQPIWIDRQARMFALFGKLARVEWARGKGHVSHDEYFEHQRMTAPEYRSIEVMPHEPPMAGVCYMHPEIPPPAGKLDGLVAHFCPATDEDRDLIKSLIVTASWGGPPGRRPAFLLTGKEDDPENGCGVGKSTLQDVIADEVYGGSIDVSYNEDMYTVKTRLLSESASQVRILRIDNVKSLKFSWAELESLITSPEVSGRALYRGNGRRPNTLMVCLTVNGASLSRDMAQRVVTIVLARPKFRPGWEREVRDYAREHRWSIIAECLEILRRETREVSARTRWSDWEVGVLSKVAEDFDACQGRIVERQEETDADETEASEVRDFFAEQLRIRRHWPEEAHVLIPSLAAAEWLSLAVRKQYATPQASAHLGMLGIQELMKSRKNDLRGWIWKGQKSTAPQPGPLHPLNPDPPG